MITKLKSRKLQQRFTMMQRSCHGPQLSKSSLYYHYQPLYFERVSCQK